MTPTTKTVREQGFQPLACDIPPGLTIAEYRSLKRGRGEPRQGRRGRSRLASLIRR
jgi:hypothetical protein